MSVNHLFGSKKRNSSILYGTDQTKAIASASSFQGSLSYSNIRNHGDGFPPNKRYKSLAGTDCKELEDPFGDSDDFTADDLEEIDVIASQALTQNISSKTNTVKTEWNTELPSPKNNTTKPPDNFKPWNVALSSERKSKGQCGSSTEDIPSEDKFRLEALQAQYEEAKKRLKEMQDDILIKNGEIKVLRDSMRQMETTVDEQRKLYAILEKEKNETLNEKEKEFSKKLQSLQSELHFRDAEMNELRTKLLNCERIKSVTPSISHASPKKSPRSIMKIEGCTQTEKKGCPTKDSFGSDIPVQASCSKTQLYTQALGVNQDSKIPDHETKPVKQESNFICAQKPGAILINALLKQPVVPGSSFGLCYLLSSNVKVCPGPAVQSSSFNTGSTENYSGRTSGFQEKETLLGIAQKLALTGLNLIAVDEGSLEESSEESKKEISHLRRYKIPGGIYLLPLLEYHIAAYHQALMLPGKPGSTMSGNQSTSSSRISSNATTSSGDDFLSTLEEFVLISLAILYYLVFYSWDVASALLNRRQDCSLGEAEILEKDKPVCRNQPQPVLQVPDPEVDMSIEDQAQHPLFKKLLQLLTFCTTAAGCQRYNIMKQCLRILVKLAERATVDLLISFQHLLNRQAKQLLRCMSSESPLFATHLTVKLLTLLAQHPELAAQFCSCSESCLFLALYTYITSRPDKSASEMLWLQLEQETVRLLIKCTQCCSTAILLVGKDCQCNSEVVKALIIMLHRQWLTVRRVEGSLFDAHGKQVIQFLRDTVLLLHSLSQKDKLFHEHCLEVLHQYDHVMPGIRAILRKVPDLKACEELALDELCPLEPETEDQEMECS